MIAQIPLFLLAAAAPVQDAATPAPVVAVARPAVAGNQVVLPTNTEVRVTVNEEVSSKKVRVGAPIDFRVASDVMIGDYVVIPKGTPAKGAVTWRTGKGAFGKSAKMEFEVRSIQLDGREIPVSGKFRQEGEGNTGAAIGAVVAVGVFGAFVTGRSAVVPQGAEYRVFTKDALPVTLAGVTTAPVTAAPVAAPVQAPAITPAVVTPVAATPTTN